MDESLNMYERSFRFSISIQKKYSSFIHLSTFNYSVPNHCVLIWFHLIYWLLSLWIFDFTVITPSLFVSSLFFSSSFESITIGWSISRKNIVDVVVGVVLLFSCIDCCMTFNRNRKASKVKALSAAPLSFLLLLLPREPW